MANTIRLPCLRYDFPALIDFMKIERGVEIGTLYGYFSYHLLRHSNLKELWSVDSWSGKYQRYHEDAVAHLSEFGDRSRIVRMPSVEAAGLAEQTHNTFGFIYIDANHLSSFVQQDIDAWLPRLQRPGILAGHDYIDGVRKVGVISVVDKLAEKLGMPVYLTREEWASWFFIFGE